MSTPTTTGSKSASQRVLARSRVPLTPAAAVRIARELLELSQVSLAQRAGLTQSTISAIERGAVVLGVERAKRLAVALGVHPAVLLFPDWDAERPLVEREVRKRAA